MKLATFAHGGRRRVGAVIGDAVADVTAADDRLPRDMIGLLTAGRDALDAVASAAERAPRLSLAEVELSAPVPRPGKILGIGLNYLDHARETGREPPAHQIWFNKQATAANGPHGAIAVPSVSDMVDYEAELALVIGRRCKHVPAARAHEAIAGFMCGNDVSVRDWQKRSPTMQIGKSFDTHAPMGPWLTTADETGPEPDLPIRCVLNGETVQDSRTGALIFKIPDLIAHLTQAFTLEPGDVLFTGTPHGVGVARTPPVFLKAGDTVRVEIEGLGALENPVVAEEPDTLLA